MTETEDKTVRTYAVAVGTSTFIVRARSNKQAISYVARQEQRRVQDLATCRIATFEDGIEAERHGIQPLDATTGGEDINQLDLGV